MDSSPAPSLHKSKNLDLHDPRIIDDDLATRGIHHDLRTPNTEYSPLANRMDSTMSININRSVDTPHHKPQRFGADGTILTGLLNIHRSESGEKGHAHDPLDEEPLFLGIGNGDADTLEGPRSETVAESPTAAEFNIYDRAYQEEVDRIRAAQGSSATVYLTRRVGGGEKEDRTDKNMFRTPLDIETSLSRPGFKGLFDKAREKLDAPNAKNQMQTSSTRFSDIAAKAMENTKIPEVDVENKEIEKVLGGLSHQAAEEK
jgi:[calcium/calmodulin-dependent protein kinase] kinase